MWKNFENDPQQEMLQYINIILIGLFIGFVLGVFLTKISKKIFNKFKVKEEEFSDLAKLFLLELRQPSDKTIINCYKSGSIDCDGIS